MIDITAYASEMWSTWFGGESTPPLRPVLLSGGPAHKPRAIVFIFASGNTQPSVVLKVAFTQREADFLIQESRALTDVIASVPSHIAGSIPASLGVGSTNGVVVAAAKAVPGRRILVPDLAKKSWVGRRLMRKFFSRAFGWTRELSLVTQQPAESDEGQLADLVHQFLKIYPIEGRSLADIRGFGGAVSRSRIRWQPCWQHRDVSVGNVLAHRGRLRFLDWEHAGPASEPWFDVAYAPCATALLARRQRGGGPLRDAALSVLSTGSWMGIVLKREMNRVWNYALPLSWAVTLVAMSTALRRQRNGRPGWPDWGELALAVLTDGHFRKEIGWLAPDW